MISTMFMRVYVGPGAKVDSFSLSFLDCFGQSISELPISRRPVIGQSAVSYYSIARMLYKQKRSLVWEAFRPEEAHVIAYLS